MTTTNAVPALLPGSTTPRVDAVIAAVMAQHPGHSPAAQARYFDAVHQELAPLARQLEAEVQQLQIQVDAHAAQVAKLRREAYPHPGSTDEALSRAIDHLNQVRHQVRDNTWAMTFQTLRQYRQAMLDFIRDLK